jgi:hypothetical protein
MDNIILTTEHNDYTLDSLVDIPDDVKIIIKVILAFDGEIEGNKKKIMDAVSKDEYKDLKKLSDINSYLMYSSVYRQMREMLWKKAPADVLAKIANGEPFKTDSKWRDEGVIIPFSLLPNLKYKDYPSNDNKAAIAKKLGAKLVG